MHYRVYYGPESLWRSGGRERFSYLVWAVSGCAACGVECLLQGSAGTLLTHKLLLGPLLLAWNIRLMVMKPISQALVSLVCAALLWVTVTSQINIHWTHMSPLVWLVVAWERDLHACACMFTGACGFGCRCSRSPGQGEVQLPHHCHIGYLVALGGLTALLARLLIISHSKTLVFIFHSFSKTSFRQIFHALGRFLFLKVLVNVVLLFMRTRRRLNNVAVSKAKKG